MIDRIKVKTTDLIRSATNVIKRLEKKLDTKTTMITSLQIQHVLMVEDLTVKYIPCISHDVYMNILKQHPAFINNREVELVFNRHLNKTSRFFERIKSFAFDTPEDTINNNLTDLAFIRSQMRQFIRTQCHMITNNEEIIRVNKDRYEIIRQLIRARKILHHIKQIKTDKVKVPLSIQEQLMNSKLMSRDNVNRTAGFSIIHNSKTPDADLLFLLLLKKQKCSMPVSSF